MNSEVIRRLTENTLWLAPLAGLTDRAFRIVCRQAGADVVVSEMVSADGLLYNSRPTYDYMRFTDDERPFGIQLFGSDPDIVARGTAVAAELHPDFIDLNLGCPVKKVVKRNAGSALLRDPQKAAEIIAAMKRTLSGTDIPLSAKIRSGWDHDSINAVEVAQRLEAAGLDILTVHPRTRSQMYAGHSDWSVIAAVKAAVSIPVVGNGDVRSGEDAQRMKHETGCDAIMIGRGALGHPWVFAEVWQFCLTNRNISLSYEKKYDWLRQHVEMACRFKAPERVAVEMRIHLAQYTRGLPGGATVRERIQRSTDVHMILDELQRLYHG